MKSAKYRKSENLENKQMFKSENQKINKPENQKTENAPENTPETKPASFRSSQKLPKPMLSKFAGPWP